MSTPPGFPTPDYGSETTTPEAMPMPPAGAAGVPGAAPAPAQSMPAFPLTDATPQPGAGQPSDDVPMGAWTQQVVTSGPVPTADAAATTVLPGSPPPTPPPAQPAPALWPPTQQQPGPLPGGPAPTRDETMVIGSAPSSLPPQPMAPGYPTPHPAPPAGQGLDGFFTPQPAPGFAPAPGGDHGGGAPLFDGGFGGGDPFGNSGYRVDHIQAKQRRQTRGWRRVVSALTFGLIRLGPGAKQRRAEEQIERIRAQLSDVAVIAFVNAKGGVGKTTTAVSVGNAIASNRGDRVIVVDVDTDLGNLSSRFREHCSPNATIEALSAMQNPGSYSNVRAFTVQNEDRLEMLSSQNDPRSSYRFSIQDFESTMRILRMHYNVILLDCGTGITSPLFAAIAAQVSCLVVVASQDPPGLNGAWRTLSWLQAHGFARLLPLSVLALNATRSDKPTVDMADAEAKFREHIHHIIELPFDRHLHEGGFITLGAMKRKTRKAAMALAGAIAGYYPTRPTAEQFNGAEGF